MSTCHAVYISVLILFMIMPYLIINTYVSLMYELKKNGKLFTGKFVGTGPLSYEKRIYRAAASQRLINTLLKGTITTIICLMNVIDCENSPARGVRCNAVRALGPCLSGQTRKKATYKPASQLKDLKIRAFRTSSRCWNCVLTKYYPCFACFASQILIFYVIYIINIYIYIIC